VICLFLLNGRKIAAIYSILKTEIISYENFDTSLLDISIVMLFICFGLFTKDFFKSKIGYKIMCCYLAFVFLLQLAFKLTFKFQIENWFLSNVFLIGEFFIISYFYFCITKSNLQLKIIQFSVILFILLIAIQYSIDYTLFFRINPLESLFVSLSITTYCTFYLYEILDQKKLFYYNTIGALIYQCGSVFVFLGANLFLSSYKHVSIYLYNFHTVLAIVYAVFVIIEWRVNFYKTR
jgi:hypothetical protein